jgi:hypothetical protein
MLGAYLGLHSGKLKPYSKILVLAWSSLKHTSFPAYKAAVLIAIIKAYGADKKEPNSVWY